MKLLPTLLAVLAPLTLPVQSLSIPRDDPIPPQQTTKLFLKVTSPTNHTTDGMYLSACHIGAAQQTLCLFHADGATPRPNDTSAIFSFNTTVGTDGVPNDAGSGVQGVGWDGDSNQLYVAGTVVDDSTFVPDDRPVPLWPEGGVVKLRQWYACWVLFAPYYYFSLAWVTAGAPHNPTCQAVNVVKVLV
ncbi:hypothetical protein B0T19DRAFT_398839 [Cercophora scortea]|uniref:DUF7907 domain-containing protein n=1 Tax=Cercophora scortea TaxID=314031 RepID=A0AAE0MI66_9PEZI|nr:hypothetical protein B0T19DRAFT_398839 [Cercophora scortea]